MLQDIRDNSQGVIAKVIIGVIVAIFALAGVEFLIGGFVTSPPVAEVNGEEITEAQLQISTQSLLNSLGGDLAGIDQQLVEELALNQLIEETLLRQRAEAANLQLSSDRVDLALIETPQFQIGGVFDADLAVRTLAAQGFSVQSYRQDLAQRMALGQLVNAFSNSNFVTEAELEAIASLAGQTRDFRYLTVVLGNRTQDLAVSEAEIADYYDANQEQFREDETVTVSYVVLDQNDIADSIEVPESDLLTQYEEEREAFEGSSEKRVSHILFEVIGDRTEEQALNAAADAVARLEQGEDFAALAQELSDDTISAEQGGDIGYTDGSAFPGPIEDALLEMSVGEVAPPVVTEFGVHVIKLTEDDSNVYAAFEDVRDRIEREMKQAEVELIYAERLEDLSNLAFETGELETISQQLELPIQTSQPFSRSGGSGIFANPAIIEAAYSDSVLLEGNNSDAIELTDARSVVLRLDQFNESVVPPLEEVEAEIAVILRREREREAVQDLGQELMAAAQAGTGLEALMAENELEWNVVEGAERSSSAANRQIVNAAFSLPAPEGGVERSSVTLPNGTFVLLELNAVYPGSLASISDAERESMRSNMAGGLGSSDFEAYLNTLRSNADVQRRTVTEAF